MEGCRNQNNALYIPFPVSRGGEQKQGREREDRSGKGREQK